MSPCSTLGMSPHIKAGQLGHLANGEFAATCSVSCADAYAISGRVGKMNKARIYKPAKTSMQSGRGKSQQWVLEYPRSASVGPESLMGWQSSSDTQRQIRMRFSSKEDAIAYAEKQNISFELQEPNKRNLRLKTYADNFASNRKGAWTH